MIQQGVLLIGTLAGAVTDAKTGYIYDWITYPMILLGLLLSIAQGQWVNIGLAGILFITSYLAYRFGKIGGGDVKIFAGIALLNPYNDINFLMTIAIMSASGAMMFYSTYYIIKYVRKGIKIEDNKKGIMHSAIIFVSLVAYLVILGDIGLLNSGMMMFVGIPFCFGLVFMAFQKGIRKNFFEESITLKQWEEDEVIAEEANTKKVLRLLRGKTLITKKEILLLKKEGVLRIVVLRNLPKFGPFIFIGTLIAVLWPNFISIIMPIAGI